jgi:tRNA(Arg) A34 adenosine deaminase TadA
MNLKNQLCLLLVCLTWSEGYAYGGIVNVAEYKERPGFSLDEIKLETRDNSNQRLSPTQQGDEQSLVTSNQTLTHSDEAQAERDEIFSLLAMAVVLQDWQKQYGGRGHNIGSVLVTSDHLPVFYARNSIIALDNATQHGEVRLVQNYLNCKGIKGSRKGLTVYTTLESCVMCAGMMAMVEVSRVIYVQKDPYFGGVREALKDIHYPRVYFQETANGLAQKRALEAGYDRYRALGKSEITGYLYTEEARNIFKSAKMALHNYTIKFPENGIVLDRAQVYLNKVKRETFGDAMTELCPFPLN